MGRPRKSPAQQGRDDIWKLLKGRGFKKKRSRRQGEYVMSNQDSDFDQVKTILRGGGWEVHKNWQGKTLFRKDFPKMFGSGMEVVEATVVNLVDTDVQVTVKWEPFPDMKASMVERVAARHLIRLGTADR